ncbi:hypothetical protein OBBRIDRAFT_742933, partial [Obba rivulosa]
VTVYKNALACYEALQNAFKTVNVAFRGAYFMPADPLVDDKERVRSTAHEIWLTMAYRFRVQDHLQLKSGHKTCFWCCQDKGCKDQSKARVNPKARPRDTLGMHCFPCCSSLVIAFKDSHPGLSELRAISINIQHHDSHIPYYKVDLPGDAAQLIAERVHWSTPNEIVREVQAMHPYVTAAQVHGAWSKMSEVLWKRHKDQVSSAKMLLDEFKNDVDFFIVDISDGVEQVCWGIKQIAAQLQGKIVEIGLDATYNTNSRHLELYSIMAEYDIAGFPFSYCLLSTASSIDIKKRTKALRIWAEQVRDRYDIHPSFVHVNKDI